MFPEDAVFGLVLLCQMCLGLMGNSWLFMIYIYMFLSQPHLKKPIVSIFMHLTLVNILTIIFALLPPIMLSFGVQYFLSSSGCKTVVFLQRVTRGLSICTTALLSAFQAITISFNNSKWMWLKAKLPVLILTFFFFFWIVNMLTYIPVITRMIAIHNFTLVGHGYFHTYCQTRPFVKSKPGPYISVILLRDLLFMILMLCSSLYMVNLLYRYHRRAQHIHSPRYSLQTAAELKATRSILVLVSCFVFFYCLNNLTTLYSFYTPKKILILEEINAILSSSYPTFCPFLLIKNNNIISQYTTSFSMMRISCC